ncbi:antibiotic biosynthesis monooxygenase [Acidisoma cellulosilytica]|uniref:Antibiotic biosynthesis monooxygenase n=1 Tax=Acidisoma cellulosilyticum TaxID=2802395 RepID=A0A964E3L0_9PROT|nr:antibiotic biosynthesis monooxygenase [Acidisoma cellulosilyticum]MCB8880486.1 antibiotic biosynthesis monooxygenase [Acidisoma cellulosilyticum]
MFIATNRFKINPEQQNAFRERWLTRETHLETVPGFVAFHLLEGPSKDDHVLFVSHTIWQAREDFEAWTRSEQFRAAHAQAAAGQSMALARPEFEGFSVVQELVMGGAPGFLTSAAATQAA